METITDTDHIFFVFPNCLSGYQIVDVDVEAFVNYVRAFCGAYVEERGNNLILPLKISTQLPKIDGQVFFVKDMRVFVYHSTGKKLTLTDSFFQDVGAIPSGKDADKVISLVIKPFDPARYETRRSFYNEHN